MLLSPNPSPCPVGISCNHLYRCNGTRGKEKNRLKVHLQINEKLKSTYRNGFSYQPRVVSEEHCPILCCLVWRRRGLRSWAELRRRAGEPPSDWLSWLSDLATSLKIWPPRPSAADLLGLSPRALRCHPKMAASVLQQAAAAGGNYWLDCGKWGQMQSIIREPVDSGSLSQWLVINKIIGERWQRFLKFFLICMSFCAESFMTFFFSSVKVDSLMTLSPTVSFACAVWAGSSRGMRTCILPRPCSHLLHKCCLEPSHLHVWMSHKHSRAAVYPVRSASRYFLDLWAPQNVDSLLFFYSRYSNERSGDFLTNTIQHIRKKDVYHSFSNYISPA